MDISPYPWGDCAEKVYVLIFSRVGIFTTCPSTWTGIVLRKQYPDNGDHTHAEHVLGYQILANETSPKTTTGVQVIAAVPRRLDGDEIIVLYHAYRASYSTISSEHGPIC